MYCCNALLWINPHESIRMKQTLIHAGLGLSLLCGIVTQSAWADSDVNKAYIDQTMSNFMQQYAVPGIAVAVYDNGVTHTYTYGVVNTNTKKPVTTNTLFEMGSITKLMTTLLIAQGASRIVHYQADADIPPQLKLDGVLPTYLPAYAQNPVFKTITLLNLATFTASLPMELSANIKTDTQIFAYIESWKPPYPIGTEWQYSNMSIGILGAVLQSQYHQPLGAIYQQMIFAPLHMNSSGILLSTQQEARLAQGYTDAGKPTPPAQYGFFPSAYAMKSTITDMSKFLAAAVGAPNTNPEIEIGMQVAQAPRAKLANGVLQGMGWQLTSLNDPELLNAPKEMNMGPMPVTWLPADKQQYDPNWLIDKTGATDGFRAYIAVIPAKQKGIVIMMNRYVSNGAIVDLGRQLLMQEKSSSSATQATSSTTQTTSATSQATSTVPTK